jgi:hypothetical protein
VRSENHEELIEALEALADVGPGGQWAARDGNHGGSYISVAKSNLNLITLRPAHDLDGMGVGNLGAGTAATALAETYNEVRWLIQLARKARDIECLVSQLLAVQERARASECYCSQGFSSCLKCQVLNLGLPLLVPSPCKLEDESDEEPDRFGGIG